MPMIRDRLTQRIQERRDQLEELDRQRLVLTAEIRAYEDALEMVPTASSASSGANDARKPRRSSANWNAAMAALSAEPIRAFDIDEVLAVTKEHGFEPTRGNVRSQMAAYVARNWVEREGDGIFKVTGAGRNTFLHDAAPEIQAEEEGPETEPAF